MKDKFMTVIKHPLADVFYGCLAIFVAYRFFEASLTIRDCIYDNDIVDAACKGISFIFGLQIAGFFIFYGVRCLRDAIKKFKQCKK